MSGAALPAEPLGNATPAGVVTGRGSSSRRTVAEIPTPVAVEVALFAALGGYGLLQWSRLVSDPPAGRLWLALAITCVAGVVLRGLAGLSRRRLALAAAIGVGLVSIGAALVVVGLPARLLAPAHWSELVDELGSGLGGIEGVDLPYAGGDDWIRLTLLLGVPALLGLASAASFWPARRREPMRVAGLALLITLFAVPATLDDPPGSELLWGLPLLIGAAAWLWVARMRGRRALVAIAVVSVAGIVALPVASRLDAAWWDWQSWDLFTAKREVTFDWNHHYGPLDWPRDGTTLLEVHSDKPLYWKASVLDRFDGFTWQRAQRGDELAAGEVVARRHSPGAALPDQHSEWKVGASFDVKALSSALVIGAGETQAVQGVDGTQISADGTLVHSGEPLHEGEQYSIVAYVPQPSIRQLRLAPANYPEKRFSDTTLVGLPATLPVQDAGPTDLGAFAPTRGIAIPLWGHHDPLARGRLLDSPYADTYRLAQRLTADSRTPYDAVHRIETTLRDGLFDYTPTVPQHTYPLESFLFEDRAGYCQQFAGSMALMLRMIGIPSRVVSGFAPGRFDSRAGAYQIRDFDAHAWVEVYFRGIGWVTFDPTPGSAPAASQRASGGGATILRRGGGGTGQGLGRVQSLEANVGGGVVRQTDSGSGPLPLLVLAAVTLTATRRGNRLLAPPARLGPRRVRRGTAR